MSMFNQLFLHNFAKYTVCTYLYGIKCIGPQSLHDGQIEKELCPTQVNFNPKRNNFNFDHRGKHTFANGYESPRTEYWMYLESDNKKYDKCHAKHDGFDTKQDQQGMAAVAPESPMRLQPVQRIGSQDQTWKASLEEGKLRGGAKPKSEPKRKQ